MAHEISPNVILTTLQGNAATYVFNSENNGVIDSHQIDGEPANNACTSYVINGGTASVGKVVAGDNTIVFNSLSPGYYNDSNTANLPAFKCEIMVDDNFGYSDVQLSPGVFDTTDILKPATFIVNDINNDATVTSPVYTININGSTGTITNIPTGISRASFLASYLNPGSPNPFLQMGNPNQTWNYTGVSDPVASGDTLVVIPQSGIQSNAIVYHITVNGSNANIVSANSAYVVATSTNGTTGVTSGTIIVPIGTQEGDLSNQTGPSPLNLVKVDSQQSWVWSWPLTNSLTTPVANGDTLTVQSQDGTKTIVYTITVDYFN